MNPTQALSATALIGVLLAIAAYTRGLVPAALLFMVPLAIYLLLLAFQSGKTKCPCPEWFCAKKTAAWALGLNCKKGNCDEECGSCPLTDDEPQQEIVKEVEAPEIETTASRPTNVEVKWTTPIERLQK